MWEGKTHWEVKAVKPFSKILGESSLNNGEWNSYELYMHDLDSSDILSKIGLNPSPTL